MPSVVTYMDTSWTRQTTHGLGAVNGSLETIIVAFGGNGDTCTRSKVVRDRLVAPVDPPPPWFPLCLLVCLCYNMANRLGEGQGLGKKLHYGSFSHKSKSRGNV